MHCSPIPLLAQAALLLAAQASAYLTAEGDVVIPGASSYNGLNLVPQMGWNTWNSFGCDINEKLILDTAAAIVKFGLRDLGYHYVIVDDCWSEGRNETGHLVPHSKKFPNGIKYVADRIHSLGLKFGIYSSAGIYTCGRYPGSLGYETQDATVWASWGVDYVKYDNCFNQGQSGTPQISFQRYNVMSQALNRTGRPIVYGLCNWGQDKPYDWAYTISNSWRMSGDIYDSFNRPDSRCPCSESTTCQWPGFHCSVMTILNMMASIQSRSMSGAFNDMDMLEVGNAGQSDSEYVVHFSMWALNASPLLMGTSIPNMSPATLSIYANPAVIALNQDPSASAAVRKWREEVPDKDDYGQGEIALWTRELANGDTVIALLNAGNVSRVMSATAKDVFLDQGPAALRETWDVYDLWANRMSDAEAARVLNGTEAMVLENGNSTTRYNASRMSYEQGLKSNATALFGVKVGTLQPGGTWKSTVDRHSVGLFRLRKAVGLRKRDEL